MVWHVKELKNVDDATFCKEVNITSNGLLTYTGLLMFGKAPYVLRYVPTFCIDYIEIPAPTIQQAEVRYTYRIPEQQNIWEAIQIILRRFHTLVDAPIHIKNNGFATIDNSQYNVLREALANMVMHCYHFDSLRSETGDCSAKDLISEKSWFARFWSCIIAPSEIL